MLETLKWLIQDYKKKETNKHIKILNKVGKSQLYLIHIKGEKYGKEKNR